MTAIKAFLDSPSNRTGIVSLVALLLAVLSQYLDHSITVSGAVYAVLFGIGKIVQPDNTAAIAQSAVNTGPTK